MKRAFYIAILFVFVSCDMMSSPDTPAALGPGDPGLPCICVADNLTPTYPNDPPDEWDWDSFSESVNTETDGVCYESGECNYTPASCYWSLYYLVSSKQHQTIGYVRIDKAVKTSAFGYTTTTVAEDTDVIWLDCYPSFSVQCDWDAYIRIWSGDSEGEAVLVYQKKFVCNQCPAKTS